MASPNTYKTVDMTLTEVCDMASVLEVYKNKPKRDNITALSKTYLIDTVSKGQCVSGYLLEKATATESDDPFFVLNINQLFKCYKLWVKLFPTIRPYYAVKANDDPLLLSMFASFGMGFDCASKEEICQILELGVSPDDIVFANPYKKLSDLRYAHEKSVSLMTFDDKGELQKIASEYKDAKLLVRIKADDPTAVQPLGSKFGCSVSEACTLLEAAKELKLEIVGVCFHVGYGSQNPDSYKVAIKSAHEVFNYASSLGYHFTVLDIGGGYPGCEEEFDLLKKISQAINSSIAQLFSDREDLTVIAEPGQYFCRSLFSLVVQVFSKKQNEKFAYYINDGVYGSFRFTSYANYMEPLNAKQANCSNYPSVIWGPTCDSGDKVCEMHLPELEPGDWLVCRNAGAYTLTSCSTFNGFPIPKTFYFVSNGNNAS